jgi:hypothetical protein
VKPAYGRDRSLVPWGLLSSARRVLGRAAERALARVGELQSARLQRVAASALREVASRWPRLASLIAPLSRGGEPVPVAESPPPPRAAAEPGARPSLRKRRESLELLRSGTDFADRVKSARALGDVVDAETTAALGCALRDASSEVAVQAAESLARHGGKAAIEALRGVLQNADGYVRTETRASAVRALGSLLPPNEAMSLATAVADPDATVSLAAIAALADRDEAASANALMGVLEDRGGFYLPVTRLAAARGLSRLHGYDGPRLRTLVDSESDPDVRGALESLASGS